MVDEPEGFAARWSRRKRHVDVESGAEAEEVAADPEALAAEREARQTEEEANRLAAEAIDLDAAKYGDDFSVFLRRGVPDILRRKALRRFFGSDPLLANLDGLNDYDEDYNNPAHMVYKSVWDTARGYLGNAEEAVRKGGEGLDKAGAALEALSPEAAPEDPTTAASPQVAQDEGVEPPAPQEDTEAAAQSEAPRRVSLRRRLEG